ncbi:dihydrofolate reductase [Neosynechococcus sphagnicola sy1]|uniref:dihydrofolate reductase n=1 Tax=Neosynechococcus sphagnicola sy1 TaxID=1497020 RepID=A0A098TM30_9CYAN|nr:dihydrofolate reductase [Neosynechococcus sphagnicola]KGF73364.1 dihydrofolate reductase [Neosynechococcus sphagnicola sy1]
MTLPPPHPSPEVIIIAALAVGNRVIGSQGKVPWCLPEDSQRFQQLTLGHTVIMGRHTWELDLERCPLPQRRNIVVSTSLTPETLSPSCTSVGTELQLAASLDEALQLAKDADKIFIVGGAALYTAALPVADTLDLTLVEGTHRGDTFFPDYEALLGKEFTLVNQVSCSGYRFETYRRHWPPNGLPSS